MERLRQIRLSALVVWLAVLSSCATEQGRPGAEPTASKAPVTVRALMSHDPPSLSLIGKNDRNVDKLAVQVTDSLVQYDSALKLVPRLAESWRFSDDHLTLSFTLRLGLRWHDGREVTSGDVAFTVEQVRLPEVENRTFAPEFADLVTIETPDPRTVVARYSEADPDVLESWRLPIIPSHLAETGADLLTGEFSRHPVGCGPFRFVSYRPGEEIVLEANDDYWDGRPFIDRLVFRIYPEHATAFQALLTGELDTMVAVPELYGRALEEDAGRRLEGQVYYRLQVWQVVWNVDGSNPFFTDPRVRQAMVLALDREGFNRSVTHGLSRIAGTAFHPETPWHDPALRPLPYEPEAARELLAAAGWVDADGDGVRERDGRPFAFTLLIYSATQKINDHMAAWMQQSWAEVGARAEIEKVEWRQFRERRSAHQFDAAMGGVGMTTDPDLAPLFHSSARNEMNYGGFADAEVDRLLDLARQEFDPARRLEVVRRLERRLYDLQPVAWLFHFPSPLLHDRRLVGIRTSPLGHWTISEGPRLWRWEEPPAEGD